MAPPSSSLAEVTLTTGSPAVVESSVKVATVPMVNANASLTKVVAVGVRVLLVLELSSPALVAVTVKAGKLLPALTNAAPVMVKVTAPVLGSMA